MPDPSAGVTGFLGKMLMRRCQRYTCAAAGWDAARAAASGAKTTVVASAHLSTWVSGSSRGLLHQVVEAMGNDLRIEFSARYSEVSRVWGD